MNRPHDPRDAAGPDAPAEWYDTVIVGGGQAGLSVGYHLARLKRSFVILDGHERIGDRWREHYDSLRLYSPAKYDGLPGMPFPAPPYTFPSGHQMTDYLEAYAARMQLPILAGVKADGVWPAGSAPDGYIVTAGRRRFAAAQVVVATGGQQVPSAPSIADQIDPGIRQLHSSDYRNPSQLLPGAVLVVVPAIPVRTSRWRWPPPGTRHGCPVRYTGRSPSTSKAARPARSCGCSGSRPTTF